MALINNVKAICDRLAPLGWRDLIKKATNDELDIAQPTTEKLRVALARDLPTIEHRWGFEDFHPNGNQGIVAGQPARSVLYHALASPHVVRDPGGVHLGGFPTMAEIETVENYVFAVASRSLARITLTGKWAVVVYAVEYRPAQDSADGKHADLAFSRTGICRIGTAEPFYREDERGFWPEEENNPKAFRVIPGRFSVWLAQQVSGASARVMRLGNIDDADAARQFWIPAHKLFEGSECLTDVPSLSFSAEMKLFNMKLQRVMKSLNKAVAGFPFVINTEELAELRQMTDRGRFVIIPKRHDSLVIPAENGGKPLTYHVPNDPNNAAFATYTTETPMRQINGEDTEIHRYPAYVHARTKVEKGKPPIDLNDSTDVGAEVAKGDYDAQLYVDFTGEGWLSVSVPELIGQPKVEKTPFPAYVLLSAPDVFPSCGQRELSEWSNDGSKIPPSLLGSLWGVSPQPLSETRLPANLQLPGSPFAASETTVTAVVGMADDVTGVTLRLPDANRASILPDDAAGEFAPGWDVSVDVKGEVQTGTPHLAAYGLGSPFPEDAKLCAALSTFWPAVAPDVYRSMSPHTGNPSLRGTVAPLTDEEIGQIGDLPWDGILGPQVISFNGAPHLEMARFQNVDYVDNAVQNRFTLRLISRITDQEYQDRVLAAARVHFALSDGASIATTRNRTLFLSFRAVPAGDPELQNAQNQGAHTLAGQVYRIETCKVVGNDPTIPSPRGPRFRLLLLKGRSAFFVSATDRQLLRKSEGDLRWTSVPAE